METKTFPVSVGGKTFSARVFVLDGVERFAIRPICEAIGIDEYTQVKRLKSNPQFSCQHMLATGSDGKTYQMASLPLDEFAMWLCNISANKVKPEIRDVLIAFQKRCQMELYAALTGAAGLERVRHLEMLVAQLSDALARQGKMLEEQAEQLKALGERDALLLSNAGRHLASAKINNVH